MTVRRNLLLALAIALSAFAQPTAVRAADYHRQTLVGWPDPFTPPKVTTRCVKWASTTGVKCNGLKCRRTTWKTCVGHAYDTQYMRCELILRVPTLAGLPASLQSAAINVARACAAYTLAVVGAIAAGTSPAAALAALQPTFVACVHSRGGQALAAMSLAVDRSCGWHK
jgi:hypothetical protein